MSVGTVSCQSHHPYRQSEIGPARLVPGGGGAWGHPMKRLVLGHHPSNPVSTPDSCSHTEGASLPPVKAVMIHGHHFHRSIFLAYEK